MILAVLFSIELDCPFLIGKVDGFSTLANMMDLLIIFSNEIMVQPETHTSGILNNLNMLCFSDLLTFFTWVHREKTHRM